MKFVKENKDRIEIVIRTVGGYNGTFQYRVDDILITPYRKRKAISLAGQIRDRYEYRVLDRDGRFEYIRNEYLKYCAEEQILEAVNEEYKKMAPTKENILYLV